MENVWRMCGECVENVWRMGGEWVENGGTIANRVFEIHLDWTRVSYNNGAAGQIEHEMCINFLCTAVSP